MKNKANQLDLFEATNPPAEETASTEQDLETSPDTYKGLYAMHKYWSKKPPNLVGQYIERYSKPGELVLDPFCGSGVTVIESARSLRRSIGLDINPIAVFSTLMGVEHVDTKNLKKVFETLRSQLKQRIDDLYRTKCPNCGHENAVATHTVWDQGQPSELWVECPACSTEKAIKVPSREDIERSRVSNGDAGWYPDVELVENYRINARAGDKVAGLFTPRALYALSLILQAIHDHQNSQVRRVLEFCFSATLPQASNMVFVIRRRNKVNGNSTPGRAEVGSWVIGYWIPPEHFEINAWRCFENRFRRVLRGKVEVNTVIPEDTRPASSFAELAALNHGYWVSQGTATKLAIPDDSIDYVFTDPPHGNRIPYLELSLMWNAWLRFDVDWENEIIVSEAKHRHKDITDYESRLKQALSEIWRVLKPGRYLSLAFNSLDDDTWIGLLNIILSAGFSIAELTPLAYSARSVVQDTRKNALKTDFVITCQKQPASHTSPVAFSDSPQELTDAITRYLRESPKGRETYEVLNHLLKTRIPSRNIFRISDILTSLDAVATHENSHWRLRSPTG